MSSPAMQHLNHPLPLQQVVMDEYCPVLVLDNGSGTCKAGFSSNGNNYTLTYIPISSFIINISSLLSPMFSLNTSDLVLLISPNNINTQYSQTILLTFSLPYVIIHPMSYLYDFNSSLFFQMHPVPCFLQLLVVPPHQCDDGHGTERLLWVMRSRPGETLSTSPIPSSMASSPTGMTWRRSGTTLSTMVCPLSIVSILFQLPLLFPINVLIYC